MGISNFSTLVFLIKNWASIISKSPIWSMLKFWPDPHLFNLLGPKLLLGLNCNSLQFWPVGPVHSPIRKQFSGPKSPFGPICNSLQNWALWPSLVPIRKQFSGPDSNFWFLKVQNNFGPISDLGSISLKPNNHLENPNN